MKKIIIIWLALLLAGGWFVFARRGNEDAAKERNGRTEQSFDKGHYSLDDPGRIWVIVNKRRPLNPKNSTPRDLRAPSVPLRLNDQHDEMKLQAIAAQATETLFAAAKKDKLELMVASAYRSSDYQKGLYNGYVKQQGQAAADTQSARPGHSEHQTGLALDVEPATRKCEVEACFADLPEGQWVAANAYKHGFVLRYHKDKESITGYIFEPWHLRYVGKALAQKLHDEGDPTLEEFFSLPPAPDYQ